MGDIIIRPAMERELEALWHLQRTAFAQEALDNGVTEIPATSQCLESFHGEFRKFTVLAALHGAKVVGMVRGREEGGTCYVCRLAVETAFRQKGIGRRLLEAIEACFPLSGRYELITGAKSERNIKFYTKMGYKIIRREPGPPELVVMEKVKNK